MILLFFAFRGLKIKHTVPADTQTNSTKTKSSIQRKRKPRLIPRIKQKPLSFQKNLYLLQSALWADSALFGTDENFDYSTSLNAYYESNGPDYFFQNVKDIFEADDLTIANFEGTLTDSDEREEKDFAFKAPAVFPQYFSQRLCRSCHSGE